MSERMKRRILELEEAGWAPEDIASVLDLPLSEVLAEMVPACEHGASPFEECRFCISDREEEDRRLALELLERLKKTDRL